MPLQLSLRGHAKLPDVSTVVDLAKTEERRQKLDLNFPVSGEEIHALIDRFYGHVPGRDPKAGQ